MPPLGPFHDFLHPAALHFAAQAVGRTVDLQADVGDVQGFDQMSAQPEVQFQYALTGDPQVLFPCRTTSRARLMGARTVP